MSKIPGERNHNATTLDLGRRIAWISELAQAAPERLETLWDTAGLKPDYRLLRAPEIGLVMTRGRAGGTGAAFNLGEATATRCSVRLASGEEGHGYALGRDKRKVEIAALCDALMQTDASERLTREILAPLAHERSVRETEAARRSAATKVEFFTMTRGDD